MKKIVLSLIIVSFLMIFSSCGVNHAFIYNQNLNSTQVHLANNNFKVIDKVSGSAEVPYIFFIGGLNKRQLYENAYSQMVSSADLISGSKAIINVVTEEHIGGLPPFYFKRTVTVSAHVVEFTN